MNKELYQTTISTLIEILDQEEIKMDIFGDLWIFVDCSNYPDLVDYVKALAYDLKAWNVVYNNPQNEALRPVYQIIEDWEHTLKNFHGKAVKNSLQILLIVFQSIKENKFSDLVVSFEDYLSELNC